MPTVDCSEGGMEVVILDVDTWRKRSPVDDVGPIVDTGSCLGVVDEPEDRERRVLADRGVESKINLDTTGLLMVNVVDARRRRLGESCTCRCQGNAENDDSDNRSSSC
jgi:hypothetical protein